MGRGDVVKCERTGADLELSLLDERGELQAGGVAQLGSRICARATPDHLDADLATAGKRSDRDDSVAIADLPLAVWPCAQRTSQWQRYKRYLPESNRHPGKMLPALARMAIEAYSDPGDLVVDPMCGIGQSSPSRHS